MQDDAHAAGTILADYLTEADLAAELGVSTRTLIRWRRLHEAPAVTRVGRKLFYRREAITKWLAARQREAA